MPSKGPLGVLEPDSDSRRIFISYRREDSSGHVLALMPVLLARFGERRIFKDTDSIPPGQDFVEAIRRELGSCVVMLVVIGREWLTIEDERTGMRRLDDPDDLVRIEVATALANTGVLVVPVLVRDARMPGPEDLPSDIHLLARRNAVELTDSRWNADAERLVRILEGACGDPEWAARLKRIPSSRAAAFGAAATLALIVGVLAWALWIGPEVSPTTGPGGPLGPHAAAAARPMGTAGNEPGAGDLGGQGGEEVGKENEIAPAPAGETGSGSPPSTTRSTPTVPQRPTKGVQEPRPPTQQGSPTATQGAEERKDQGSGSEPPPQDPTGAARQVKEPARTQGDGQRDRTDIRAVLERFRQAYSRKDEDAVRQVYPEVRADRMFRDLEDCARLSLTFEAMDIRLISADEALVDVRAVYGCQPRTGQGLQLSSPVTDTFRLARHGGSWVVARRLIALD